MNKQNKHAVKRLLALFMALAMCMSLFCTTAFAAPDEVTSDSGESSDGSEVTATVTVTPKGDPTTETVRDEQTGNTTTTTTTESEISGKGENGGDVTGSQTETETTVTDSQDRVVKEAGTDKGEITTTNTTTTEETNTVPGSKGEEEVTEGTTTTTETKGEFEDVSGTKTESSGTQKVEDLPYAGDITVNLTPGEKDKTEKKALTDEELAALLISADRDYPLNEIGKPTVETNDNGDKITTTRTQEDGQFVKTVLTEKSDGSKVEEKTTVTLNGSDNGKGGKNVTEFTITTVTTTTNAPESKEDVKKGDVTSSSNTVNADPVTENKTTITLPEKPLSTEAISADGTKTVVTVENILDENGETVGYQTTTTVTSADGKRVSSESASLWGTKTTVQTTTQTDTTTKTDAWTNTVTTTTTTLITQGTTINGHKITATEREVTASMSKVTAGTGHGTITMSPTLTPNVKEPNVGSTNTTTDLYHRADGKFEWGKDTGKKDENGNPIYNCTIDLKDGKKIKVQVAKGKNGEAIPVSHDFEWFGEYGLESAIRVKAPGSSGNAANTWQPHQFVLTNKDGEKFYVYCADFEVSPANGAPYNMTNIEDANYYGKDAAEHIRYIAENGYWGTKEGTGSLTELKNWLKEQGKSKTGLTDRQIDNLTEGQALTATQAAIWHFGNSGDQKVGEKYKDIVGQYYTGSSFEDIGAKADDKVLTQKLYEFLIKGQTKAPDETTLITENVFATTSSITVGDKVTEKNEDGTDKTDANGNTVFKATTDGRDYYKTDVSFGMSVVPSNNGDLIVQVVVDNEVVATRRLAGDDSKTNHGMIQSENGNYTISGLELPNGSKITLNLSGTQALEKGVYLYTCATGHEGSQTFVGMGQGTRAVDLSVDLNFSVKEPEATIDKTGSSNTQQKTDTVTQTREDKVTQKQVSAEITVTTTTTTEDKNAWDNSWEQMYTYPTPDRPSHTPDPEDPPVDVPDPDVPLVPGPEPEEPPVDIPDENPPLVDVPEEQPPLVEVPDPDVPLVPATPEVEVPDPEVPLADIPDEDVPLADVPNTGDVTGLWCALGLVSCAGLAYFFLDEKKRQNNAQ